MADLFDDRFLDHNGGAVLSERGVEAPEGRVYFALLPDSIGGGQAASRGNSLVREHGLRSMVSLGALHVSLFMLGWRSTVPDEVIDGACYCAARLVARPFQVVFDRAMTYQRRVGKSPLVVFSGDGALGVALFRQALIKTFAELGVPIPTRRPDPHMTLLYDHRVVAEQVIDPIRWTAREFVLVHSIRGEGKLVPLGCWPLRG